MVTTPIALLLSYATITMVGNAKSGTCKAHCACQGETLACALGLIAAYAEVLVKGHVGGAVQLAQHGPLECHRHMGATGQLVPGARQW